MESPVQQEKKYKDFDFRDDHFNYIRELVHETSGIMLGEIKRDMVYGRLVRRLRTLGHKSFDQYLSYLKVDTNAEIVEFTNALTTNLTAFFREGHHLEFLSQTILPSLLTKNKNRKIRIWSAGCSTGEEPYSIAIVVKEWSALKTGWDVKILASDLDSNVVADARSGIYKNERVQGVANSRRKKWFQEGHGANEGSMKVSEQLQDLISFRQLNLMHEWPMKGPFDVIFCRNVVIYFNKETQRILFDRYADYLTPGGYLIIGHSESLHNVTKRFRLLGKTVYQKIE